MTAGSNHGVVIRQPATTNPYKVQRNHRVLAAEAALEHLYGATGLIGVTAKARNDAVNHYLVSRGQSRVSADTIRRALRTLKNRHAAT